MATLRRSPASSFLTAWALASVLLTTLLPALAFGAPLVVISRPANGATVSGQIWIDVNFQADKNLPIVRLEVYIDDQLSREFDLAQPLLIGHQTFSWDFSYASNSVHKIGAKAIDSGNNGGVANVSVTVQNTTATTGPDVIPPVVRIYYPAQGAKLSGRTEIKADANDNVGVEMVVFYIDGKLHKVMMNAPPYVDSWDTTREEEGRHVLEATAVDKAENEARSASVTVIVENHGNMTLQSAGMLPSGMSSGGTTADALPTPQPPAPTDSTGTQAAVVPAPVPLPAPAPTVKLPDEGAPAPVDHRSAVAPVGPAPAALPSGSAAGITAPGPVVSAGPGGLGGRTQAPAPSAPKVVNVVPWALPATVPPAPPAPSRPGGSGGPVAIGGSRQGGLTPISPRPGASGSKVALARPGAATSGPAADGQGATAPKSMAPSGGPTVVAGGPTPLPFTNGTAAGPVTIQQSPSAPAAQPLQALSGGGPTPVAPSLTVAAAALAKTTALLPLAAKASAPAGALPYSTSVRMTMPGPTPPAVAAPVTIKPVKPSGVASVKPGAPGHSRVVPVGPTIATAPPVKTPQPVTVPAERKQTPGSGLSRITPPTKVASVTPPVSAVAITAALAEYRGLPIPASRMLARLPETQPGKLSADGRVTQPQGDIAAVPIAIRTVTDIKIVFDGEVLSLRATPDIKRGISLAPLREIFEQTDGVLYWFPVERQVHAVNKNVDMKLKIGNPEVTVNGEQRTLVIAPYIKRGRTMVPLQFIADVLDVNIAVDSATGQITISSNQL